MSGGHRGGQCLVPSLHSGVQHRVQILMDLITLIRVMSLQRAAGAEMLCGAVRWRNNERDGREERAQTLYGARSAFIPCL